jgi:hypothetical protein
VEIGWCGYSGTSCEIFELHISAWVLEASAAKNCCFFVGLLNKILIASEVKNS